MRSAARAVPSVVVEEGRRAGFGFVVFEGASRVKGGLLEVTPLGEGAPGCAPAGVGGPLGCSRFLAVASWALHGLSPGSPGDGHLFAPAGWGVVWFGSPSGGRDQTDGHVIGGP
jgi:hypothetical protein